MSIFKVYDIVHEYIHNKINVLILQENEYVLLTHLLIKDLVFLF